MQYYKHPIRRPAPTETVCTSFTPTSAIPKPPAPPENTVSSNPMTGFPLAMAYVPYQAFEDLYEPNKALERGTLFRALDMPFVGQKRSCT